MKQASLELNLNAKRTRKRAFLEQMERVVPWTELVALIVPYYIRGPNRPPTLCAEDDAAHAFPPAMVQLVGPDESTILRFLHRLEKHKLADEMLASVNGVLSAQGLLLKEGSAVDATLIAAPNSTKNKEGKHDLEMHSSK